MSLVKISDVCFVILLHRLTNRVNQISFIKILGIITCKLPTGLDEWVLGYFVSLLVMDNELGNIDKIVQHWLDSADKNYETMNHLVDSGDYSWALFMGHLVVEKTLKALYVKKLQKHAIFSHDLLRLASKINLELCEDFEEWLDEITTFNLNARYDNYKQDFYNLCNKDFTEVWLDRIEEIRLWLRNQL